MINDNDPLLAAIADSYRFLGPGDFMIAFPQLVDNQRQPSSLCTICKALSPWNHILR
jgi:hypothetical protein